MGKLVDGIDARIVALQRQRTEVETRTAAQLATLDDQLEVLQRARKVVEDPEVEAVHALLVSAGLIKPIE